MQKIYNQPLTRHSEQLFQPIAIRSNERMSVSLDREGIRFIVKFYSVSSFDAETKSHSSYEVDRFLERIPEKKRLDAKYPVQEYLLAATDTTCLLICRLYPANQILWQDDAKLMYNYLLATSAVYAQNGETVAQYKHSKTIPGTDTLTVNWQTYELAWRHDPHDYGSHVHPLSPYQRVATHCAVNSESYALYMAAGTGKTPVGIATICEKALANKSKKMYRVFIACPKNVRTNWVDEFEKFSTVQGKVTVLRGTQFVRIKQLLDAMTTTDADDKYTVVITSYETMSRMIEALKLIEWDLGILDESHYIKSPVTKRSVSSMQLRDVCKQRLILTGTPIANTPLDLYSQLEFLGKGWSGFLSWKNFKKFYGVWEKGQHGDRLMGLQNMPFIKERLATRSFIISKEEALPELPDKVYDVLEVVMTPEQRAAYEEIRKNLILEIERDLATATNITKSLVVQNVLVKLLRLAQITSGFVAWDAVIDPVGNILQPQTIEFFNPNVKVDAIVDILREKEPHEKTIIWAAFQHDIKAVMGRLEVEHIKAVDYYGLTSESDREDAIQNFNNDFDTKVFVGNPGAGGTGVNLLGYDLKNPDRLNSNANHVIFMSQDWSSTKRSQAEDRCHRRGTREPIRITDLCVAGTVDEEIRSRVLGKRILAHEISDVRQILKTIISGVIDDEN